MSGRVQYVGCRQERGQCSQTGRDFDEAKTSISMTGIGSDDLHSDDEPRTLTIGWSCRILVVVTSYRDQVAQDHLRKARCFANETYERRDADLQQVGSTSSSQAREPSEVPRASGSSSTGRSGTRSGDPPTRSLAASCRRARRRPSSPRSSAGCQPSASSSALGERQAQPSQLRSAARLTARSDSGSTSYRIGAPPADRAAFARSARI